MFSLYPILASSVVAATGAADPPAEHSALPHDGLQWFFAAIIVGIVASGLILFLHRTRNSRSSDAKQLTSAQLGILAVAVGAVLGFAGAMLSKHDPILDLIVAAVTSVLVIQIAETLRSHHLSKRMQSLERALDAESTYSRMDTQLNALETLSTVLHRHPNAGPLFSEFLGDAYNKLNDSLDLLSDGTIRVNNTARELTFNKDCLQHLANHEVWAVSYEDGTFWDDPEGRDFLDLHDEKIKSGVTIHRIFLLKREEIEQQRSIIEAQMARKIDCRILLLDSASNADLQPEDFVIYDEVFVRSATRVTEGPTTTLKYAILSCDQRKVRDYLQKRSDFKTRSEPALNVLERSAKALASGQMNAGSAPPIIAPTGQVPPHATTGGKP